MLPQFLPRRGSVLLATLFLALIASLASLACLALHALVAHHARSALTKPRASAVLDRITGITRVGLGTRVALARDSR